MTAKKRKIHIIILITTIKNSANQACAKNENYLATNLSLNLIKHNLKTDSIFYNNSSKRLGQRIAVFSVGFHNAFIVMKDRGESN